MGLVGQTADGGRWRDLGGHPPSAAGGPVRARGRCATHESASRDGTKGNDELWIDHPQFPVEPPAALLHFASIWVLVKTPFAPLEMLYGVGDIDRTPVEANRAQGLVEDAAGRSDERTTSAVFLIAGLLVHHHESRVHWAFTENNLRRIPVKRAALTTGRVRS